MRSSRGIVREMGTAFAVLAIYLLTILAPLHHARASQLDFEALGYHTVQTGWALCNGAGQDDGTALVAKCPAAGIGKQDLIAPALAVIEIGAVAVPLAPYGVARADWAPRPGGNPSAPPRAPPSLA